MKPNIPANAPNWNRNTPAMYVIWWVGYTVLVLRWLRSGPEWTLPVRGCEGLSDFSTSRRLGFNMPLGVVSLNLLQLVWVLQAVLETASKWIQHSPQLGSAEGLWWWSSVWLDLICQGCCWWLLEVRSSQMPRAEWVAWFRVNSSEELFSIAADIKCLVSWYREIRICSSAFRSSWGRQRGGRKRVYDTDLGSASYKAGDLGKGALFLWLSLLNYKMKGVG